MSAVTALAILVAVAWAAAAVAWCNSRITEARLYLADRCPPSCPACHWDDDTTEALAIANDEPIPYRIAELKAIAQYRPSAAVVELFTARDRAELRGLGVDPR